MRIVQLNPFYYPYAGGTERRILELGKRLVARGHEVHVVTARLPGTPIQEVQEGLHIHRLPSRFRLQRFWNPPLVSSEGIEATLRELRPDVIDFHYRWARTYSKAYRRVADLCARVFTYNNGYGEGTALLRPLSRLNDRRTRGWISESDQVIAVSEYIRQELVDHGFPAERLDVVPNGISSPRPPGAPPADVRGRRYLAACGRLVGFKGYDVAIESLLHLPKDLHLAIAGTGPELGALRRLARRRGVADRVHLLGWIEEDQKQALLAHAECFVHPTRFEAFGIAPLEAMAHGTPVVASRVGGLPEVVGTGGILVDERTPEAFAQAIARQLAAPQRDEASQQAKLQASRYSWDSAADRLERIYAATVEGKTT